MGQDRNVMAESASNLFLGMIKNSVHSFLSNVIAPAILLGLILTVLLYYLTYYLTISLTPQIPTTVITIMVIVIFGVFISSIGFFIEMVKERNLRKYYDEVKDLEQDFSSIIANSSQDSQNLPKRNPQNE